MHYVHTWKKFDNFVRLKYLASSLEERRDILDWPVLGLGHGDHDVEHEDAVDDDEDGKDVASQHQT